MFTSFTNECMERLIPVNRSPKESSNNKNPIHQFKSIDNDEIFQIASLPIFMVYGSGKFSGPIST